MKLTVIGFGRCGGQIADTFARLNKRARHQRGVDIILDTFAVNSGETDLGGLRTIKSDYNHRILIGGTKTLGHSAAKLSELGAQIARDDSDKIVNALRSSKRFGDADAILMVAATGGGTGSGAMPVLAQHLKERYWSKPIYCMAVLPFEHEEQAEARTVHNTALCLKSTYTAADAVILVENQRFHRKDSPLKYNTAQINAHIVEPFYNLLCAGEERRTKHIGTRVIDAADIIETFEGWTAIGYGKTMLPMIRIPFLASRDYRKRGATSNRGIQVMEQSISEMSVHCYPKDTVKALYLISAPTSEMNSYLTSDLSEYLRDLAPNAVIRAGDYPDERSVMDVVTVLSALSEVRKVKTYYVKATTIFEKVQENEEVLPKRSDTDKAADDLPTLL